MAEDVLLPGHEIDGDATKRNRQLIEVLQIGIGQHVTVEKERDLIAGVESGRKAQTFLEAELKGVRILAIVLFPAI